MRKTIDIIADARNAENGLCKETIDKFLETHSDDYKKLHSDERIMEFIECAIAVFFGIIFIIFLSKIVL